MTAAAINSLKFPILRHDLTVDTNQGGGSTVSVARSKCTWYISLLALHTRTSKDIAQTLDPTKGTQKS